MAASDAKPIPQKNVAYRVTFPLYDVTGALVTGATGLDSEVSKDGAAFADCTNEATEIATSSGVYYLDLTSTEMNADTVAIIVKTTSAGALTSAITLYPEEAGDIRVNVTTFNGTAGTFTSGRPEVHAMVQERSKYMHGAVWIGSVANTNTTSYTDGIITNPVSTIAAAKTIADALGLRRFWVQSGVTVTLTANMVGYVFDGWGWILATSGSQSVANSTIMNCRSVTGTFSNAGGGTAYFENCEFGATASIANGNYHHCEFGGTATLGTGNYDFIDCASVVAGTSTPIFDCSSPGSAQNLSFRRWSGGITLNNINSNTTVSIDMVSGGTVTLNGSDGNEQIRGMTAGITDNRIGAPTLGQNAAINITKINAECDTALSDYDAPTNAEMVARTLAAADYATATSQTTIAGYIDTEVAAIKAKTDNLPAAPAATGDIPTAAAVADAVWDESLAGHAVGGSAGAALASAGALGDPWSTAVPGAYGAGTAGKALGDITAAVDTEIAAIKAKTDNLPAAPAATGDIPSASAIADAVLDELLAGHAIDGSAGSALTAIKTKTDNLPAAPAGIGDAMTLTAAYDFAKGTVTMTEAYAADGASMTPQQALYMLWSLLAERSIDGTTLYARKLDGTTVAMTFTLDSGTTVTAQTRAT